MNESRLKLHTSKTEYINFGNQCQLEKCFANRININDDHITENQSIKHQDFPLDEELNYQKHIDAKCQKAMHILYPYVSTSAGQIWNKWYDR